MTFFWLDEAGREVKSVQGTGFLISSQVVMTAKHNFYHRSRPGVRCTGCLIQLATA
jgi:V8-like Glu-specific endopeptidase